MNDGVPTIGTLAMVPISLLCVLMKALKITRYRALFFAVNPLTMFHAMGLPLLCAVSRLILRRELINATTLPSRNRRQEPKRSQLL